ncbi:MAG: FtsW/RodA/SpoVE family cell cycle protein, partial [Alphaproteobacteria bacterium]
MSNIYRNNLGYGNNSLRNFSRVNFGIPICLFLLGVTGILMLFSISGGEFTGLVSNHLNRLLVGFCFFLFFATISFRILRIFSPVFYVLILLMLIWLLVFENSSVSRWINIGTTSFQPSEFLKIILIITLASYYSFFGEKNSKKLRYNILPILSI